jgi:GPH family glycoside/pentoside/hexuronide:cation symporter
LFCAGGYVSGAQIQPRSLITSIYFAFIYVPMILAVLQIILLWLYKLDREYPTIAQELHERGLAGNRS